METSSSHTSLPRRLFQRLLNWLAAVFPEAKQKTRCLVPEVDPIFHPESILESGITTRCPKAETHHPFFIPFPDFDLQHLPERWRHQHVLQDIQDIARRVVKLRVRKPSADRFGGSTADSGRRRYGHHGTGFVTYDSRRGAVVHTSKHVVLDPYEAQHTDVIFFCDADGEGVSCRGSSKHFRSVWAMDYSSFTLELLLPDEVQSWEDRRTERTFSWRVFSLSRLLYRQSRDVDVIIISHPHGSSKQVSVGKMSRRHNISLALYSATTCPGSSGAPVVRLSDDYMHYVAAGQFVHHGFDGMDEDTATGMGQLRPPITLPYYRVLDVGRIRRVVALLYEPVSYWTLYLTDFLEIEGILFNCTDNFCYFLTLYGYFCGWQDSWTVRAFWGFVCVISCQMILYGMRGPRYALLHAIHLVHALSMHWVTWLACVIVPRDYQSLLWLAPLWLGVLFLSRHMSVTHLFGLDLFHAMLKTKL